MSARPFLRWSGGKTRLLPELLARVPADFDVYIEPFVGAGSLFFALADRLVGKHAVLTDANPHLIGAYSGIAHHLGAVICQLGEHAKKHSARYYRVVRSNPPDPWDLAKCAAWVIYLNHTSFNGLWRVNGNGEFNAPMDASRKRKSIVNAEAICACSEAINRCRVTVGNLDFRKSFLPSGTSSRTFIYADPPYVPTSATANFTAYTRSGFTMDDQRDLAAMIRQAADNGAHVLVSQSNATAVRELYAGFQIDEVIGKRSVAASTASRGACTELLIHNLCGGTHHPEGQR